MFIHVHDDPSYSHALIYRHMCRKADLHTSEGIGNDLLLSHYAFQDSTRKEMSGGTHWCLVILSSKTYVFGDKLTKCSVALTSYFFHSFSVVEFILVASAGTFEFILLPGVTFFKVYSKEILQDLRRS